MNRRDFWGDRAKLAALFLAGASGALLAGAHLLERVGGLAPCALCLIQREALWAALLFAALAYATPGVFRRAGVLAAAAALTAGALLALSHAGVERGLWAGPAACTNLATDAPSDLARALETAAVGPSCDEPAIRIAALSLAEWNMIISAALALVGVTAVRKAKGTDDVRF